MTIRQKALAYIVLQAFISLVLIIFTFNSLDHLTRVMDSALPGRVEKLNRSIFIKYLADRTLYFDEVLTQSARNYAFTQEKEWKERYFEFESHLQETIDLALEEGSEEDKENFQKLAKANTDLVRLEYKSFALVEVGRAKEALDILSGNGYLELKEAYKESIETYTHSKDEEVNKQLSAMQFLIDQHSENENRLIDNFKSGVTLFILVLVILTLVITYSFTGMVSTQLGKLKMGAKKLSKGNFEAHIEMDSKDEFEELAQAFNSMSNDLKKLTQEQKKEDIRKELNNQRDTFRRELHDRLGIIISSLKLHLEQLRPREEEGNKKLAFGICRELLTEAYAEIRELSDNPLADTIHQKGIKESLSNLLIRTEMIFPVQINFFVDIKEDNLSKKEKTYTYAIVRELMNNAIKHGKASTMDIQFIEHDDHFLLMVEDNGVGFNPGLLEEKQGSGLSNIEERIQELGGRLFVDSEKGKGSTLTLEIPKITNTTADESHQISHL